MDSGISSTELTAYFLGLYALNSVAVAIICYDKHIHTASHLTVYVVEQDFSHQVLLATGFQPPLNTQYLLTCPLSPLQRNWKLTDWLIEIGW